VRLFPESSWWDLPSLLTVGFVRRPTPSWAPVKEPSETARSAPKNLALPPERAFPINRSARRAESCRTPPPTMDSLSGALADSEESRSPHRPLPLTPSRSPWARSIRATAQIRFTPLRSVAFCESVHVRCGCPAPHGRSSLGCCASLKPSLPAPRTSNPRGGLASPSSSTLASLCLRPALRDFRLAARRLTATEPFDSWTSQQLLALASRLKDLSTLSPGEFELSVGETCPRTCVQRLAPPPGTRTRRQRPVSRTHPKARPSGPSWTVSRRSPFFHDLCPDSRLESPPLFQNRPFRRSASP
jgi:hypothetical protein